MKKKKSVSRKTTKKTSKISYYRFSSVTVGVLLVMSLLTAGSFFRQHTAVLGASTTNTQQSGFSLSNFFAPIISFFTHMHASNTHNTNAGNWFENTSSQQITNSTQVTLSQEELTAMAGDIYANGNVPLGDNKYTTSGPKKGYIYLCNIPNTGGGGAENSGSWLGTTTWNPSEKPSVQGSVTWSNASFSNTVSGNMRTLSGNGLPVNTITGNFPISSSDPAYQYDRNPNSIKTQTLSLQLPASPSYSATPNCMGMEVGVMLNGVPLFNGFDAEMRDAPAHEIQDSCDGHPESTGEYHYHSLSRCIKDTSVQTVIGFALDGFPITGPTVSSGKYLTTNDLDECHGITSQITLDGKQVTLYHYVMTEDFPYSVSCFRGKPVSYQVIATGNGSPNKNSNGQMGKTGQNTVGQGNMNTHQPPQAAITACSGKATGSSCSFSGQNGTITGICQTPPNQTSAACVPANRLTGQQNGQNMSGPMQQMPPQQY